MGDHEIQCEALKSKQGYPVHKIIATWGYPENLEGFLFHHATNNNKNVIHPKYHQSSHTHHSF